MWNKTIKEREGSEVVVEMRNKYMACREYCDMLIVYSNDLPPRNPKYPKKGRDKGVIRLSLNGSAEMSKDELNELIVQLVNIRDELDEPTLITHEGCLS